MRRAATRRLFPSRPQLRFGLAGLRRASALAFEDRGGAFKRCLKLGQRRDVDKMFTPPIEEVALDPLREGTTPVERGFHPSLLEGRERCTRYALLVCAGAFKRRQLLVLAHISAFPFLCTWRVGCTAQSSRMRRVLDNLRRRLIAISDTTERSPLHLEC